MKILNLKLMQKLFQPFGRILENLPNEIPEVSEKGNFNFYVIFKEFAEGWQIGYLEQMGKNLKELECHPTTPEVFVPIKGKSILLLSVKPGEEIVAFKLDKPIILNRGVWHGVISLTEKSEILIVENQGVTDEFCELKEPITDKSLKSN